jgi:hypothetical protein
MVKPGLNMHEASKTLITNTGSASAAVTSINTILNAKMSDATRSDYLAMREYLQRNGSYIEIS